MTTNGCHQYHHSVHYRTLNLCSAGADPAVDGVWRQERHLGRSDASVTTYVRRHQTTTEHT